MADELLPCPFCGSDGLVQEADGKFYATCAECYCCVGEAFDSHAMPDHIFNSAAEAIAAWNARLSRPSAVKPLNWEQPDGPEGTSWLGHGTDMCQFYIRFDAATASYWMPGESNCEDAEEYLALDEAKAAAQADYAKRIRSALTHPSPQGGAEPARVIVGWQNEMDHDRSPIYEEAPAAHPIGETGGPRLLPPRERPPLQFEDGGETGGTDELVERAKKLIVKLRDDALPTNAIGNVSVTGLVELNGDAAGMLDECMSALTSLRAERDAARAQCMLADEALAAEKLRADELERERDEFRSCLATQCGKTLVAENERARMWAECKDLSKQGWSALSDARLYISSGHKSDLWEAQQCIDLAQASFADTIIASERKAEAAESSLAAEKLLREQAVMNFAGAALHGDDEHRAWLLSAAEAFVAGQPLPPPNGKGRAEALEQRVAALVGALNEIQEMARDWGDFSMVEVLEQIDDVAAAAIKVAALATEA